MSNDVFLVWAGTYRKLRAIIPGYPAPNAG
jgi:hypothetical protein